jgi:isoamylase
VGGSRWLRVIDTDAPQEHELMGSRFGHVYPVPGRSLLLFVLQPARTPKHAAAERSFQRVVQAVEESTLKSVRGFD